MVSSPTVAEVRLIITTALSDAAITAIIADAVLIVEECAAVEAASEARQKAIVKWVTAHLIFSMGKGSGQLTSKTLGDASESYATSTMGANLKGSSYGQQALMLEPSGCLANLGNTRATFTVL